MKEIESKLQTCRVVLVFVALRWLAGKIKHATLKKKLDKKEPHRQKEMLAMAIEADSTVQLKKQLLEKKA